jgi:hypothetical protein
MHCGSRRSDERQAQRAHTRNFYTDTIGTVRVESVLVEGLVHAFQFASANESSCGRPGDFVVAATVCAVIEIARFWGLPTDK